MARIVFTKVKYKKFRDLGLCALAFLAVLFVLFIANFKGIDSGMFLVPMIATATVGIIGMGRWLEGGWHASCSDCGANLSKFCHEPSEDGLIHCPACGVKFEK